ncbi:hypothetical protein B7Y92_02305 [Candidatus Saccharibacteria bacterium 32-50-13]|nr:MAG: hypothetical protein B7Y92_02305 [Candidatus Saccharibacteria bacterium 32-50-13]
MRSLSLSKPHLIFMVGGPGAGKSFFAERFSQTFSTPLVSWRRIRNELFNDPVYTKDEDDIVERVAFHMLDELFKTGATVLYESNVQSQVHRQEMMKIAKAAGYETLFVWSQVDTVTAKSRAAKSGLSPKQYDRYENTFTPPKPADAPVVISGKHTYPSQLKIVLMRLVGPRAAGGAKVRPRPANHNITVQ